MGRRGPIPRPNSSESQRRRNTMYRVTVAPPAGNVTPPASVIARPPAASFWSRHAEQLAAEGRLREDQVETFGILCHLYADCEQLLEQLVAEGWVAATDKGQAASPVAKLLRDSRRDYVTLAKEFGLSPASAARLPQAPPDDKEKDIDSIAAFNSEG